MVLPAAGQRSRALASAVAIPDTNRNTAVGAAALTEPSVAEESCAAAVIGQSWEEAASEVHER